MMKKLIIVRYSFFSGLSLSVTRQMKTLTYSLASTKCMDDGWTVRALSPVGTETGEHLEPFEIEINSSRAQVIIENRNQYSPTLNRISTHWFGNPSVVHASPYSFRRHAPDSFYELF